MDNTWSTKKKNKAAMMTMTNTIPVETIVSLRFGQVTFEVSWRTCCINCIGFVFDIFFILLSLDWSAGLAVAGAAGFEPATCGFGDRRSTN